MPSSIKDLIQDAHLIFKANHDYWDFLLDSYEGGLDYCKATIGQSTGANSLKNWALKIFAGSTEGKTNRSENLFQRFRRTD